MSISSFCQEGRLRPALSLFAKVFLVFSCKLPKSACSQKFAFGVRFGCVVDECRPAKGCVRKWLYGFANGQLKLSTAEEVNVNNLLSCRYNMDTNRVEARFEDGTTLAIDCIAVEDKYCNTPAQRAELDWLLYNKLLEYAQLVLGGEIERYLSLGCDHGRLEGQ